MRVPPIRPMAGMLLAALAVSLGGLAAIAAKAAPPPARVTLTVSSNTPLQHTKVTARGRVLDRRGRPIRGARVAFVWRFKSGRWTATRATNVSGVAVCARAIAAAKPGYRVVVAATATSARKSAGATTAFRPIVAPSSGDITNIKLRHLVARGAGLVDVRTPEEFAGGRISGASNVPSSTIPTASLSWNKRAPIVVY